MRKIVAVVCFGFAMFALGASVYRSATTSWSIAEDHSAFKRDLSDFLTRQGEKERAELAEVTPQAVWNKVNPPDVTRPVIESAGPGGHIVLHLSGVHASENIDNVQVYFDLAAALPDGSVKYGRFHAASLVLESIPQNGTDMTFDVTEIFTRVLSVNPTELRNFTVEFVQVPKNNGVKQNDQSFNIDWTYLEIIDAHGKPVPQEKREPRYG